MCLGHGHLLRNSNDRGYRLMPMVDRDLQQCRFWSLELTDVVYDSNHASASSHAGFPLRDDHRYHADLHLECCLQCNLVSSLGE